MSMQQGYDFGSLYGMADHSTITPLEPGSYDAIVEEASFGKTKDGTKGAWTIKFRTTTGDRAGYPITMTMSINPTKGDGTPNPQGMGIMFRQLGAMGVPIPPDQPFWALGWTEENVAQFITGKPVQLKVINDNYDDTPRSKVRDIKPARPGAPLEVQKPQQANAQQGVMPGQYQQQGAATWSPVQAQQTGNGWGQQQNAAPAAPWQQAVAGGPGYENQQGFAGGGGGGYQPQQGQAPGPWQNAQQPPQGPPQGAPGAGGPGEFTPGGQSQQAWQQQPGYGQPPQGYGQPSQPGQGGQFQQQNPFQNAPGGPPVNQAGPSAPPAGAGGQPGPYGQPQAAWNPTAEAAQTPGAQAPAQQGYNQAPPAQFQPPQGQPPQQQQQAQQGAPELPPWAQ